MTLSRLRNFTFLSLFFLLPLVLNPWGVDLYEVPKNILFKTGVGVLGILWVMDVVKHKRIRVFFSKKVGLALLFFLAVLAVSLLASLNPTVSFWGSYYKQGGTLNMLYYLVFFVLAVDFFSSKENRLLFLRVLSWSGVVVSVYALVQKLGIDFLPSTVTDIFAGRSFSSLGNPSMLATFLLFPIGAELALLKKNRPFVSVASLILMLLALLASRGRASILGLILVSGLFFFKRFKAHPKKLAGVAVLGLLTMGIFFGIYGSNTRSLFSRFSLWESSVHMIEARPIFGSGLESFGALFPSYATADFYQHEDYYNLADRPHNEFLEQWIHLGILGAGFYLFLVFFVLRKFWRASDPAEIFVAATLLAVFASNFFGFSLVTHFVFLTLFLAYLCVRPARVFVLSRAGAVLVGGLGILLVLSLSLPLRFFVSDFLFKKADTAFLAGEAETAAALVQKGQRWNPFFSELYLLSFKIDFSLALQNENLSYLTAAQQDSDKALAIDRGTLKSITNLVQLYKLEGLMVEAESALLALQEVGDAQPLLNQIIAEFYYEQERYEEAIVYYERLLSLLPTSWQAPVITKREMSEPSRIFWKNHPDFLLILQHFVDAYQKTGRVDEGRELLLRLL